MNGGFGLVLDGSQVSLLFKRLFVQEISSLFYLPQ